jgi:hypothetical protein
MAFLSKEHLQQISYVKGKESLVTYLQKSEKSFQTNLLQEAHYGSRTFMMVFDISFPLIDGWRELFVEFVRKTTDANIEKLEYEDGIIELYLSW